LQQDVSFLLTFRKVQNMTWTLQSHLEATQATISPTVRTLTKAKANPILKAKVRMKEKTKVKANQLSNQATMSGIKTVGGKKIMMEDQTVETQDGVVPLGTNKAAIQQISAIQPLLGIIKASNSNTGTKVTIIARTNGPLRKTRSQVLFPSSSRLCSVQPVKLFEASVTAMNAAFTTGLNAHGTDARLL
jgi:hypothetical protein